MKLRARNQAETCHCQTSGVLSTALANAMFALRACTEATPDTDPEFTAWAVRHALERVPEEYWQIACDTHRDVYEEWRRRPVK